MVSDHSTHALVTVWTIAYILISIPIPALNIFFLISKRTYVETPQKEAEPYKQYT